MNITNSLDFSLLLKSFRDNDKFLDSYICSSCRFLLYFNQKVSSIPDVAYELGIEKKNDQKCRICHQKLTTIYNYERYVMMIVDYKPSIYVRAYNKLYVNFDEYVKWLLNTDEGMNYMNNHPILKRIINHNYVSNV